MTNTTLDTTEDGPHALTALRRSQDHCRLDADRLVFSSSTERNTLREARLDRIEAGKNRLWRGSLRVTQLVNLLMFSASALFIMWRAWAYWATALAAVFATLGMWVFARRMTPREERLRRLMVTLARRRRTCVVCGYLLRDLTGSKCPECGAGFDSRDDRHILAQETLHLYSSRARSVSAVVSVFVLFWVSALARGSVWQVHVALALALLAAFHVLHALWIRQARRTKPRSDPAGTPHCPGCGGELLLETSNRQSSIFNRQSVIPNPQSTILPRACPRCDRRLTYADVFVRPDVRRLADRRARRLQYRMLALRWAFLVAIFAGLACLVRFGGALPRIQMFGLGGWSFYVSVMLPVLTWVMLMTAVLRYLARRQQRRLKLLFAQIVPQCPRCGAGLSGQPVGRPCPTCNRGIDPMYIRG
ncbi:MAG: zinc finger-like domain-containing protein [Phycisphaerae bacterium]|nr:zinc finger-like domain-containing protein [Phycisphaerae bacterium]